MCKMGFLGPIVTVLVHQPFLLVSLTRGLSLPYMVWGNIVCSHHLPLMAYLPVASGPHSKPDFQYQVAEATAGLR